MSTKKDNTKNTTRKQDMLKKFPLNVQQSIYLLASIIRRMEREKDTVTKILK